MTKNRMEAFSDGVLAIVITIMVLELKVPHGAGWDALLPHWPVFVSYVLSFIYLGIYWNNHHHMLHTVKRINGTILWANLHLLFWLSLIPFTTGWLGENSFHKNPAAVYGLNLLACAIAYYLLEQAIIAEEGKSSKLAVAVGKDWKGRLSVLLYFIGVGLTFVNKWLGMAIYLGIAFVWFIPDRRLERAAHREKSATAESPVPIDRVDDP